MTCFSSFRCRRPRRRLPTRSHDSPLPSDMPSNTPPPYRRSPRNSPSTTSSPKSTSASPSDRNKSSKPPKKTQKPDSKKVTTGKPSPTPIGSSSRISISPNETRRRSLSESASLQPPSSLILNKISPKLDSGSLRESPSSPMSPVYKSFPPFSPPDDAKSTGKSKPTEKLRANKSNCPCRLSSDGKEWLFKCGRCLQHWHASCSNLKGANKILHDSPHRAALDTILQDWLCPWCFDTSFPKPASSTSAKLDKTLKDSVNYSQNIQAISDAISSAVSNSIPTVEISSLEARLKKLSEEINMFQKLRNTNISAPTVPLEPADFPIPKTDEPPIKDYHDNILDCENLRELNTFLDECRNTDKFTEKNGRLVLKFGESYTYTGDSSAPISHEIPLPIATAIDRVSAQCKLTHRPNSVLINYYPPLDDICSNSSLPFHSDNEPEILSDSEIATISIGDIRKISFKPIHGTPVAVEHMESICPKSNSVYVMTRSSQAWYRHGISNSIATAHQLPVQTGRFSITLRTVSKKFRRSTLILGDSNTKPILFGTGPGTLGQSFPGLRAKASKISAIDPKICIGHSNVVIVCGTNDLRVENIKASADIHQLVDILHLKIQQIKKICPSIKIFVSAVLPSRLPQMNRNIMTFNRLVNEMLSSCFNQTVWQIGVGHFLDRKGLLDLRLTRNGDDIHLGKHGIAKFVRCIKQWVYVREREERTRQRKTDLPVGAGPT